MPCSALNLGESLFPSRHCSEVSWTLTCQWWLIALHHLRFCISPTQPFHFPDCLYFNWWGLFGFFPFAFALLILFLILLGEVSERLSEGLDASWAPPTTETAEENNYTSLLYLLNYICEKILVLQPWLSCPCRFFRDTITSRYQLDGRYITNVLVRGTESLVKYQNFILFWVTSKTPVWLVEYSMSSSRSSQNGEQLANSCIWTEMLRNDTALLSL